MNFEEIKCKIICLLENNGVLLELKDQDIDLREYAIDSIVFISFILDVENEFGIVIPDNFLTVEILKSLEGFINLVIELRNESSRAKKYS